MNRYTLYDLYQARKLTNAIDSDLREKNFIENKMKQKNNNAKRKQIRRQKSKIR